MAKTTAERKAEAKRLRGEYRERLESLARSIVQGDASALIPFATVNARYYGRKPEQVIAEAIVFAETLYAETATVCDQCGGERGENFPEDEFTVFTSVGTASPSLTGVCWECCPPDA